ncbi:hypothetical protein IZU99_07140 [Oscillospiraceae bacterium CM]|nr:hypothetical protein IZU99_07140 [Oscillospiraceae bacterium CM]
MNKAARLNGFELFKYGVLALMPILGAYKGILVFNLGTVLLLFVLVVDVLVKRGRVLLNLKLLLVIVTLAVLNIVTGLLHMRTLPLTGVMNNSLDMLVTAILCAYFIHSEIVDRDVFYRFLQVVALACAAFLCVQYFLYTRGIILTGLVVPAIEPSLLEAYPSIAITYGRPNSVFLEPAYFAIYVLPVYALSLNRKKYLTAIFLLVTLYLSTSTTGVAAAIVISLIFIVRKKEIPIIVKWVLFLIGLAVLVMNVSAFADVKVFEKLRFSNLKDNIRVFGSLQYFRYFGVKEILFGAGLNQLAGYVKSVSTEIIGNGTNALFFSFFSFGVVGGLLWNTYLASLFKVSRNKVLFLVLILIYLTDQILFNRHLFYLLLLLFVFADRETDGAAEPIQAAPEGGDAS